MTATIACIVTSYNNGPWLRQSIESVLAQSRRPDEIVVADDGSTDGSRDLITSLVGAHPTIRAILREENIGVAANRDLAIRAATSDLVTTLDGDDYYHPKKIEKEAKIIQENAGDVVVYSDLDFVDPDGNVLERIGFTEFAQGGGDARMAYLLHRAGPIPRDMLMPKALFERAGGFRHELRLYEDWDLKLRLARAARNWYRAAGGPGLSYRRHPRGLASADGLSHLEAQLRVIFLNREWLEGRLGSESIVTAIARRIRPLEGASAPAAADQPRPGLSTAELVAEGLAAYRRQAFSRASAHLRAAIRASPEARKYAINAAHSSLLSAPWAEINSHLPRATNELTTSGWLESVFRGEPVDAAGRPIPWYTYPAIEFLERVLGDDLCVFEWGAGNSTLWWARRARKMVSVEHDGQWYARIKQALPDHVDLRLRTLDTGYAAELSRTADVRFDVVVIDGEARNDCARAAAELADPRGLIIFDNSDRRGFRDGVAHLTAKGWRRIDFFGLIPSYLYKNCTSVFFQSDQILARAGLPSDAVSCLGPTCSQTLGQ